MLPKAGNEVIAAQNKLLALYNEDLRDTFARMKGLLSYGIATGQTNPDCRLLFDTLGDFLEAKSEGDRASAQRAATLILNHGDVFGDKAKTTETEDDRLLEQFETLQGEEATAFYNKQAAAIQRGYEARKRKQD